MRRISNYHSHIALCGHAVGTVEDYVKEAIRNGYEEIGISDHAPIPVEFVGKNMHEYLWLSQMMDKEIFENDYLIQLKKCINKYQNIHILKGLEVEYIKDKDYFYEYLLENVDYLNLGVHYFFDGDKITSTYDYINEREMAIYADTIEEALAKQYFSCLVHPDLYLYREKEFTPYHEKIARRIIEACIKNDVYMEINANGRNKYPRIEFWKIVKEYKEAKIVIGSDAHKVEDFHGENVERVIKFAENLELEVSEKMELKNKKVETKFVGHRGASKVPGVVNNCLSGFEEGIKRKYYALECDVRVTTDKVYYIHHDPTITLYNNNFTKESIALKNIQEEDDMKKFSWDDIKDLDLYYTLDDVTKYDKLILFEDYLTLCKENKTKCVIELKYTNGINTEDLSNLDGLMQIILKHEMADQVYMLTSMKNALLYIKEHYANIELVLLTGEKTTNMESIDWCIEQHISFDGYYPLVTQEMIDKLHENNLTANVWTVNDEENGQKFKDMNVDFITTDILTK